MLNAPFKIDEYNVGFKYNLGKIGQAPEVIFAQRSFEAGGGSLNLEAGTITSTPSHSSTHPYT